MLKKLLQLLVDKTSAFAHGGTVNPVSITLTSATMDGMQYIPPSNGFIVMSTDTGDTFISVASGNNKSIAGDVAGTGQRDSLRICVPVRKGQTYILKSVFDEVEQKGYAVFIPA